MKIKNLLLVFFSFLTFATFAQEKKRVITEKAVTEFEIKSNNLEELIHYDWNKVRKMFQGNDLDQNISLSFIYVNEEERDASEVRVDNFELKLKGKTSELEKIINNLKSTFDEFSKIETNNKE
ncbi:hypothetical protein DFR65_104146 [Oceanihabitans sediminis]|uniref:Uncharacterized protein n=1 Tax=Oceanihabitans sediminis TaxID=1812012 RepID=A0A368P6D2_9FLAO|nr:hypothetical protein [Oceanihabitans sediminis]RBP30888.1 hypothetical protein DFR65_104146 [Oceanihabitans sediminis]RCU56851.1 hypothetical protein DU428_10895 [Oceanihabitans sediminis]